MDFIPGKDLRTIILDARQQDQFLDETQVLNWASQLADAHCLLAQSRSAHPASRYQAQQLKVTQRAGQAMDFGLVKVLAPGEVTIPSCRTGHRALYAD